MTGTFDSYADYQRVLRLMYLLERNPDVIERLLLDVAAPTYWKCADTAFRAVYWEHRETGDVAYNRRLAEELAGALSKDDLVALLDMAEAQVAMEGA